MSTERHSTEVVGLAKGAVLPMFLLACCCLNGCGDDGDSVPMVAPTKCLTPGAASSDQVFGAAIVLDGEHGWVYDFGPNSDREDFGGDLYVFRMSDGKQVRKMTIGLDVRLRAPWNIDVADKYVVVTAEYKDSHPAVYCLRSVDLKCVQVFEPNSSANSLFGYRVRANTARVVVTQRPSGDTVPGAVFGFDRGSGKELFVFRSPGGGNDGFGLSLTLTESFLAVGAPFPAKQEPPCGRVCVLDASDGRSISTLRPPEEAWQENLGFGLSVDGQGDCVAIGAPTMTHDGGGQVYLYNAVSGKRLWYVEAPNSAKGTTFGEAIALGESIVVVGAPGAEVDGIGKAYVYARSGGRLLAEVVAKNGVNATQAFGRVVAVDGTRVAVSDWNADASGLSKSGVVYLYDVSGLISQKVPD